MRMWNVDPSILCNKHLLGEHVECHMLVGSLTRNKSIKGFLDGGLVDPSQVEKRHEALSVEMKNRGMRHRSPLQCESDVIGSIDVEVNVAELARRCEACRERQGR